MGDFLGYKCFYPQGMEKPGIERPECVYRKTAGYADDAVFFPDKCCRIGSAFFKQNVISLFNIVNHFGFVENFFLADIGVFVTAASEHIFVAIDVENADRAEIIAGLALKFFFIDDVRGQNLIDVVAGLGQKSFGSFLSGKNSDAETAHQLRVWRNQDVFVKQHGKGQRDGLVLGYTALQDNIFADCPVAHDTIEVIGHNRGNDSGGDVFTGCALLNGVTDVRIDKSRTMFAEL